MKFCRYLQHYAISWLFCAGEPMNPNKCLFLEESSSLEEEQCTQLNQKYKQLHDENWTRVEQLKSTEERVKVIENLNHVRNTQ